MCLVLFCYQPDGARPLVVAANRDEFYARPARSAHRWEDAPVVFAGRDLSAGGSWLGVTTSGRFATVTNFAEEVSDEQAPKSRGALVDSFLTSDAAAHDFAHHIHGPDYKGFNLLLYDGDKLVYTSNRGTTQDLKPGVYGLANAELGATWPKVVSGAEALRELCSGEPTTDALIELLRDDSQPPDEALPRRGRPLELERRAAPRFIRGDEYGTRASTAVIFKGSHNGRVIRFAEQNFLAGGAAADRTETTLEVAIQP
jgi:uncharacterized protein with NRDE domain